MGLIDALGTSGTGDLFQLSFVLPPGAGFDCSNLPVNLLSITDVNANPIAGGDISCGDVMPAP